MMSASEAISTQEEFIAAVEECEENKYEKIINKNV
jgi:hypothetical protein